MSDREELITRLRQLARFIHDDFTIGEEAADVIEELQAKLDALEAENARLKAALTVIADPNSNHPAFFAERGWRCNERIYEDIARDALKGE